MKDGQKDIYYITGESKKAVENSPFLEHLKKKDTRLKKPLEETTWEDAVDFQAQFPRTSLGDKAVFNRGSIVREFEQEKYR
ncbi:heat shock protein 83-like [Dorcoceras hygrometricum]|uniref:Heat shock protein 83-like n=1 Tax=Dorcoceras hygrometricum TaxID=472368 RepID=A0A2Z6ZQN5_9LAMI|nr:heat shock protein 83-like [Dorcoceras hygrometricum]